VGQEAVRLFEAVTRLVAVLSSRAPLLFVLEDLHWAGESTLGLLHHLARGLAEHPALIAGTFRPEAVAAEHTLVALGRSLARDGIARLLRLERLPAAAVETIVGEMSAAGEAELPLARRLYRETEGNPFFLIELVKALFEMGAVRLEEGAWQGDLAAISAGALPLPSGVSEAIRDRVRRLERNAQEALGLAAVLGRAFDLDLLSTAWGRGEEAALEALDALLRQRLAEEQGDAGGSDFAFTHHLIQEVVYAGLPRARRLRWHAQAGRAMEVLYAAEPEARAGEMAYHFERACRADRSLCAKAVAYLLQAGQQAVRQSAHREAIAYYRRGLDLVGTLPDTERRLQQEVELQLALGLPTTVLYGYGSAETGRVYERARELCRGLGQTPALFASLVALARHYGVGGHLETGLEIAEQLLAIAGSAGDDALLVEACRMMGGCLFALGRLKEAQGFCEQGLAAYDVRQHESHAYRFGHDPAVTMLGVLGMALWLRGDPDRADEQSRPLRDLALAMTHPSSRALAYCYLATHACLRHDVAAARDHAQAAIDLSQRHGLRMWGAYGTLLHGWALVEQGQGEQGLAELRDGTAGWRAAGYANFVPFFLGLQAEACLKMARLEAAAAALAEALAVVSKAKDRFWLAELHRLEGELVLRRDDGPWTIDN
jgi:predicted ATPase